MEEDTKDLQDYIIILRNHRKGILMIAIVIMAISSIVAYLLPATYKSSATILIEQQEIPPELVQSTVTSYASERIQTIQARVMSRTTLLEIVKKFDLYPDQIKRETSEEIVNRMRNDFSLNVIRADVVDPRTGRPSIATIAFSLSFKGEAPERVQQVTNELTSLFLNANLENRAQKAEETSVFFKAETERLGSLISSLEQKLAKFKQEYSDVLPELQQLNVQLMQRSETELSDAQARLNSLQERRFYLQSQLSLIDPASSDSSSPSGRLKILETSYASAKSRYSDDHPDVQNLRREIDALRQEVGGSGQPNKIAQQLTVLRTQLTEIKDKYTTDHPDVKSLEAQISALALELKKEPAEIKPEREYFNTSPDNPLYLSTQSQLAMVEADIKSAMSQLANAKKKLAEFEGRLVRAPQVEREYLTLRRDYENAVDRYRQTKEKQMQADVGKQLESESKGERFTLIDPAALPEKPISPNRPSILLLGFVLGIGGGLGFAFMADIISGAVRGSKSIYALVGSAPLAVIPYQVNSEEVEKTIKIKKRSIILAVATIVFAMLMIHILVSPLDVLWFRVLRKLDNFFVW